MSAPASIDLVGGDYEHTLALDGVHDGLIINYSAGSIMDIFRRMIAERAFEACEFSLSNYIGLRARKASWLEAIPVFPNRNFRHGSLHVRRESDLSEPAQLRNKKIGVQEYSMTAAVWVRGFLKEQYGVHWKELAWYCEVKHKRVAPPDDVRVTDVSAEVEDLLLAGELDAIIATSPADDRLPPGKRRLRRLIPDIDEVEKNYYRETGIFPINHCVVIREDALRRVADVASALFNAYSKSKKSAFERRLGASMIPWGRRRWNEIFDLFGGDPYPYGLTGENRKVIDKLIGYLHEQRLIPDKLGSEGLFVEGSARLQER